MRCLVTGGAGFIGSNLVDRLLEEGHEVKVLDNLSTGNLDNLKNVKNKIKFIQIDIFKDSIELFEAFKNIDWVFHLAGIADIVPSIKEPKKYLNSNVIGTFNVLEASRKAKIKKFFYAASASCYGIPKKYPTDEKSETNPQYPYALSKFLGEQLVLHWSSLYDMSNISLRFFNVYGPRSRSTGAYGAVFGVFLAQKLARKPLTIVGDGNQTRDFIHVFDLINAIIKLASKEKFNKIDQTYNIGGGKEISVNVIADLIGGEKIKIPKRPGEPDRSLANISKIKSEIDWSPEIDIKQGVKMLLENLNDWKDAPVWTPETIKEATREWFKYLVKNNE